MSAVLIVRATVPEADRAAFDHWYETEHLPDAKAGTKARAAWRGWSDADHGVHAAFYEFDALSRIQDVLDGDAGKALIDEFDRVWQGRVTRTREVIEIKQRM